MIVEFASAKQRVLERNKARDTLFPPEYRCPYADGIDYLCAAWQHPVKIYQFPKEKKN